MILSSPLNKKWNTALLSFPPILLFNYTSNFGCTIIIPQSNLVDQESFLISYSFFEIIYLLLHLNYSHCEEILQSPYSLFLFILKKEIKKSNQITHIVYYASVNSQKKIMNLETSDFWAFKNSWIYGTLFVSCIKQWGFCHVCKNQIYCSFMRWEGGDLALFFAWHHGCHVVVFFPVKRVKRHWIW